MFQLQILKKKLQQDYLVLSAVTDDIKNVQLLYTCLSMLSLTLGIRLKHKLMARATGKNKQCRHMQPPWINGIVFINKLVSVGKLWR